MQGTSILTGERVPRAPISVALATYNGERFLAAQLRSILSQLGTQDEVVVVDDASTDRSLEVLSSFRDARVHILRNDLNSGVLASFDRALGATRGEIVFLSDQDDVWLPGKVAGIVDRFEANPAVLLVLSDAEVIDEAGRVTDPSFMALRHGFRPGFGSTLIRNRYLGCAMAVRRRLLGIALPIPRDVPMHDMWLGSLAVLQGEVDYIDRPLVQYRRHGGNASPGSPQRLGRMLRWRYDLLRNVLSRRRDARARQTVGDTA